VNKHEHTILVTVIMPVYNAVGTVAEALRAIEAQDFPREQMQIVVGDNGSTDGTPELIAKEFPNVEIATTTDRGCGFARNAALTKARGHYLCCTDADCVTDPGWVSALVRAFDKAPTSVACLGGQILPYRTVTSVERWRHVWIQPGFDTERQDTLAYAATPNAAFRRDVFDTIGLFDGTLGFPDADLGLRLNAAGLTTQYVPEAIVRHRNAVTIGELYRHRLKYGVFMTRLARKHPTIFGTPDAPKAQQKLAFQTTRRVAGDLFYKLPRAVIIGDGGQGTRLWPALDAVLAVANYVGVRRAVREHL
jgi:GT2 family glycosyltransferase